MDDRVKDQSDETDEWLDALDSVEAFEGIGKVDDILDAVVTSARRKGAKLPFAANTAYVNTIAPEAEPPHPGNRQIEQIFGATFVGTPPRWSSRRIRNPPSSAAILRASSQRPPFTIPGSCISGMPPTRRMAVT